MSAIGHDQKKRELVSLLAKERKELRRSVVLEQDKQCLNIMFPASPQVRD
jgi:hypothetical protein